MNIKALVAVSIATLLAACNPVANLETGEEQIGEFQSLYSEGNIDGMYEATGQVFKENMTVEEMTDLYVLLDQRLGDINSTERTNFSVNSTPQGTNTVIVMTTKYDQGTGAETYTFLGNGEEMELVGWHVASERLNLSPAEMRDAFTDDEVREEGSVATE